MNIGIYIRVSTDEQAREGYSIDAQRHVLNAWAVVKGGTNVVEFVDEGYSAKNLNRPGVQRLIQACQRRELDMVIVWKTDRLTRNLRDLLMLMEDVFRDNRIEFISCTESIDTSTPAGRLVLNMLGAVAQNERENTSERTSMVMREMAKEARHLGGRPPYGYAVGADKKYIIDPREAEAVRMIFALKRSGASYAQIISALDASGHRTRSGGPFCKNTILDMLRNEKYTGVYIYNRAAAADRNGRRNNRASKPESEIERIPGGMPAIISRDEWEAVQKMAKRGKELGGQNSAKNTYVLSGLVRCGVCGGNMVICNAGRNRDGSYWRAYRCKNKCVKGIEHRKLESCVFDFLKDQVNAPAFRDALSSIISQAREWSSESADVNANEIRTSLTVAISERASIFKLAAKSDDPPASLLDEIAAKDAEIDALKRALFNAENPAASIDEESIYRRLDQISILSSLSPKEQKAVVTDLIESVRIYPDKIDISITTTATGGAEGSRTPVRRSDDQSNSERSLCFDVPSTRLPTDRIPASVAS